MLNVPITAVPNQVFKTVLGGQNCKIRIYTRSTGLYLDLYIDDVPVIVGVYCLRNIRLVRQPYLGFIGDLTLFDTQPGTAEPVATQLYAQLGARYQLLYLEASDL